MSGKSARWLVVGGMGFVGRNVVKYLLDNNVATSVVVADKRMPFMAFMSADHKACMEDPRVAVVQCDASDETYIDKLFEDDPFDFVVNAAAETDLAKAESFHAKTVEIAAKIAAAAAKTGACKRFVQVSTASVYAPSSKPATEGAKVAPWTTVAEFALKAEEAVKATPGLAWVILRPAIIYGPADVNGLMPRAVCAAAYTKIDGKMEFLWEPTLRMNTVHVYDVARAVYFAAKKLEAGTVWNLADKGDTDQGRVSAFLGHIFGIETGFYGSTMSTLAKMKMDTIVDEANKTHLAPWMAIRKEHGIANTPLSPFLHKQLLGNNSLYVDGGAVEAAGFKYAVPELTEEGLRDEITQAVAQGIFPPVIPGASAAGSAGAGKR